MKIEHASIQGRKQMSYDCISAGWWIIWFHLDFAFIDLGILRCCRLIDWNSNHEQLFGGHFPLLDDVFLPMWNSLLNIVLDMLLNSTLRDRSLPYSMWAYLDVKGIIYFVSYIAKLVMHFKFVSNFMPNNKWDKHTNSYGWDIIAKTCIIAE